MQAELQGQVAEQRLSCNDVLSALLWHVACDIRGRRRPWQSSKGGHGCLAYPLNLRALHVPPHYCGNALLLNLLAGMTVLSPKQKHLTLWTFLWSLHQSRSACPALCCTVLYHAVLRCAVLCRAVLHGLCF